jgi:hypothetical protein
MTDNDTPDRKPSGTEAEVSTTTRRGFMSSAAAMSSLAAVANIPDRTESDYDPDDLSSAPLTWTDDTELEAEPFVSIFDRHLTYEMHGDDVDAVNWRVESTEHTDDVFLELESEEYGDGSNGFTLGAGMDPDTAQALAAKLYEHGEWLKRVSDE